MCGCNEWLYQQKFGVPARDSGNSARLAAAVASDWSARVMPSPYFNGFHGVLVGQAPAVLAPTIPLVSAQGFFGRLPVEEQPRLDIPKPWERGG